MTVPYGIWHFETVDMSAQVNFSENVILKHVLRNLKGARKHPIRGQNDYSAARNIVSGVKLSESIPPPPPPRKKLR